jgi:hypothetical protein
MYTIYEKNIYAFGYKFGNAIIFIKMQILSLVSLKHMRSWSAGSLIGAKIVK